MVLFSKHLNSMVAAVFGLALCAHGAQAPQHVDIHQLSTTVEDVVVPLPNEIFGALNKLGAVNWKEHVRSDEEPNFTERPRIALLLGTAIADGFIAVQAEDAPAVKDIGQRVLALAKGIGVGIQSRRTPRRSSMRQTSAFGQMCGRNWIALKTAFNRQ